MAPPIYTVFVTVSVLFQVLGLQSPPSLQQIIAGLGALPTNGADLWTFNNADLAAVPESIDGVGNYLNYGVRNMLPFGSTQLFLGMADGDGNLMTDPAKKMGGWELIELNPKNPWGAAR